MSEIRIRAATAADVPLIHSLIGALAEYEKLSHEFVATDDQLRQTLFGERPAADVLLAYADETCAGFALYFSTYSTFLGRAGIFLEDVFVKPEWRGKGIGRALLARLGEIARERGSGRVEWDVLNWNEPAIGFYRRLGATPMSEWTKYRITGEALENL